MTRILLGGIIGGIVAMAWLSVSHMLLPWHETSVHHFKDSAEVLEVLTENTTESGIYLAPGEDLKGLSPEARQAAMERTMERWEQGPTVFAAVQLQGARPMWKSMLMQLALCVFAALIATWFIGVAPAPGVLQRLLIIEGLAIFALLVGPLPNWVWWGYSDAFIEVAIFDTLIAWGLAGLVISIFFSPKPRPRKG